MTTPDKLQGLVQFFEKNWFEKTGLITALIGTVLTEVTFLIAGKAQWWVAITVLLFSVALVIVIWFISRCPPKTPKNKVGFLVSISCEDDAESKKLREDFLFPLRELIRSGKTGGAFHFMEVLPHISRTIIENDDAHSLRLRSRADFMLYGRVRLRTIGGQDHHVIALEGIVAHKPIPGNVSQSLAAEFAELLPRKVNIPTENDLFSFQFTSEWVGIVAKYIIGIAATLSGSLEYGETLYEDVEDQLKNKDPQMPIYRKLIKRLPTRLSEINEMRAMAELELWRGDHDPKRIQEMAQYLQKVETQRKKSNPRVLHLRAINTFLKDRNVDDAIKFLKAIRDDSNGVWHLNMAFLFAYKGKLHSTIRHYRQAANHDLLPEIITQVEDFLCWILQEEPEKCQFFYCLGFFNWKVKGDKIQARKDFTKFINECQNEHFSKEIELSQQWLKEFE